jgi:hypothetical protein
MPKNLKMNGGKYCDSYDEYYTVGIKCPICSKIISLKLYLSYCKEPKNSHNDFDHWNHRCKHLSKSMNHLCFDYEWYPQLFVI